MAPTAASQARTRRWGPNAGHGDDALDRGQRGVELHIFAKVGVSSRTALGA
jgi:hypothetical protein